MVGEDAGALAVIFGDGGVEDGGVCEGPVGYYVDWVRWAGEGDVP